MGEWEEECSIGISESRRMLPAIEESVWEDDSRRRPEEAFGMT
jgi:hypothetical protein